MTAADCVLLLEAAGLVGLFTALVRFDGSDLAAVVLRRLRAPQTRARRDRAAALHIRKAIARAARIVPGATCLSRTLGAALMLRRRGIALEIHLSIECSGSAFRAHAWVDSDGEIVAGPRGRGPSLVFPST